MNEKIINSQADIPPEIFESVAKEREFWDTHTFGEKFFVQDESELAFALPKRIPSTTATSIRLGRDLETRLKALAAKKQMPYQTLLKEFVLERTYEEEKRLGMI